MTHHGERNGPLVALILLSTALQLGSAALVKYAVSPDIPELSFLAMAIVVVLAINLGRLAIWNWIHKHYPISFAYPMSALFFPGVLVVAWSMGESIGWTQAAGALAVMLGVALILAPEASKAASFPPDD